MSDITKNLINRKEALKRTALLLGGAVSAPTVLGFLNGCSASPDRSALKFSEAQATAVTRISDIMIPETDTRGAAEVGVTAYIEDQVFVMWEEEDKQRFLNGLSSFLEKAESELGKSFHKATPEEQRDFVYKEHDLVFGGDVSWDRPRPFIWTMKELTITGYFTSEVGMTQVMQYMQVPGYYDGCMDFEEAGGKVWAV